jgi:protein TonB
MAKIVKYCTECEEGFAEKFSFCPNCANELSAFEMKPLGDSVAEEAPVLEIPDEPVSDPPQPIQPEIIAREEVPTEALDEIPEAFEEPATETEETVFEPVSFESNMDEIEAESNDLKTEEAMVSAFTSDEEPAETVETNFESAEETSFDSKPLEETEVVYDDFQASVANESFQSAETNYSETAADIGYHITVIKEKNVKQRNALLLGSFFLVTMAALGGVVYNLFTHPLMVGAINDADLIALINLDEVPIDVEEPPKKKDDDDGGGGGGGGKKEETETSKGRLATQMEKPQFPPSSRAVKLTNPDIAITRATQGTIKRPPTDEPYGNPNSTSTLTSDGKGSGGGMGSGIGTGQGSGRGTGDGSGIGSGSGSGRGNGIGDGTGDGTGRSSPPPPPKPVTPSGPSVGLQILSKPRPGYTDSARTNNVQGTVMLRVTFLSNGRIGGVAPVKGLPHGLTQMAIAAARQIQFKPKLVNGQAVSVTKRIQYNFTIY